MGDNREFTVFEGCGHGGPGVCQGDGQTEAEGVPSQDGRGDALLRRMPPYLTYLTWAGLSDSPVSVVPSAAFTVEQKGGSLEERNVRIPL